MSRIRCLIGWTSAVARSGAPWLDLVPLQMEAESPFDYAARAEVLMRKLRDEIDESVSLAVGGGMKVTYLLVLEPSHPLRFLVSVVAKRINTQLRLTTIEYAHDDFFAEQSR